MRTGHHRLPVPARVYEADRAYSLVAVNVAGAKTPQQPILAQRRHLPAIETLLQRLTSVPRSPLNGKRLGADAHALTPATGMNEAKVRALLPLDMRQPHPLLRPLVVRARLDERILVSVTSRLPGRQLGMALVDDGRGIQQYDDSALLQDGETHAYLWFCWHAGIYPIYNRAATSMVERRCLLGVLIIEA